MPLYFLSFDNWTLSGFCKPTDFSGALEDLPVAPPAQRLAVGYCEGSFSTRRRNVVDGVMVFEPDAELLLEESRDVPAECHGMVRSVVVVAVVHQKTEPAVIGSQIDLAEGVMLGQRRHMLVLGLRALDRGTIGCDQGRARNRKFFADLNSGPRGCTGPHFDSGGSSPDAIKPRRPEIQHRPSGICSLRQR